MSKRTLLGTASATLDADDGFEKDPSEGYDWDYVITRTKSIADALKVVELVIRRVRKLYKKNPEKFDDTYVHVLDSIPTISFEVFKKWFTRALEDHRGDMEIPSFKWELKLEVEDEELLATVRLVRG